MPFTVPRFQESGEAEIIDNIIQLIDRDMKLALDYYYWTAPDRLIEDLPDFSVKTLGDIGIFNYPILVVGPERMTSQETDDGFYLNQDYTVGLGLVVKDSTVANVTRKAMKYVRALKAVLRSATAADLMPASSQLLDYVMDIDHRYFRHSGKAPDHMQAVELELKFKFGEK